MKSIITFILFLFATIVNSQWVTNTNVNTLVASSSSEDMQSIGTSDGKTIVVFWKVVASPANYELRMQKLNVDGTQAFGTDGVLISNTLPMSTYTNIWSINIDSNDNVYIGATGTTDQSGHVFKVDSNGNNLWGNTGVNLGAGNLVTTQPMSTGEVVITWLNSANKALLQKYSATGTPIWTSPTTVLSGTSNTAPANIFNHTNGDITVVFHTFSFGIFSTLWAQRYSSNGVQLWTMPTQLSNTTTAFNRAYSGVQDEDVVYFGYFGSSSNRFDSYLQRINADGTLPWGINGKDFDINQTNFEIDTKIAFTPGSQYIWALANYCNPGQTLYGEYVQKFDKVTGNRLFTDNAKELYPIDGTFNVHFGDFFLINDSPLFLLKSGYDNGGSPTSLAMVYLNSSGDFTMPGQSTLLADFSANKKNGQLNKPVGQAVITFTEDKGSGSKIYAQRFIDPILSVNQEYSSNKIYYTNPISNLLNINGITNFKEVSVFDCNGKTILTQNNINSDYLSINTDTWQQGVYFVKTVSDNLFENTIKVIKK